jgi:hypothetical protein
VEKILNLLVDLLAWLDLPVHFPLHPCLSRRNLLALKTRPLLLPKHLGAG